MAMIRALVACIALLPLSAPAATVTAWTLPAPPASSAPNLATGADGGLLLSWIEAVEGGHRLRWASHPGGAPDAVWSAPGTIAQGADWFVNWADFPALQALPDGSLWAHVLVRNGSATYAYDTRLFRSGDRGETWQALGPVHDDASATEHGFATLWAQPGGGLGIAWLDGRETGGGGHEGHGPAAPSGNSADPATGDAGTGDAAHAMTLRAATYAGAGKTAESRLDASTCDCCQTDSAVAGDRVYVAWRDRSAGEIRDIRVARHADGRWQASVLVHADGWKMPACPVNGPAIAARGDDVWVAWYTAPDNQPELRLAHSGDAGRTFAPMRVLARGERQHGRVDLAADAAGVWVSWLEEHAGQQSLWLARFDPALRTEALRVKVTDIIGRGRGTGFPRLQVAGGQAWLVWTELVGGEPRLRGAVVRP